MPAMMKGYIDRVFSLGFAYSVGEWGPVGLLTGKKAIIFNTTGAAKELYDESGMFDAIKRTSHMGILNFCGVEILEHKFLVVFKLRLEFALHPLKSVSKAGFSMRRYEF